MCGWWQVGEGRPEGVRMWWNLLYSFKIINKNDIWWKIKKTPTLNFDFSKIVGFIFKKSFYVHVLWITLFCTWTFRSVSKPSVIMNSLYPWKELVQGLWDQHWLSWVSARYQTALIIVGLHEGFEDFSGIRWTTWIASSKRKEMVCARMRAWRGRITGEEPTSVRVIHSFTRFTFSFSP